MTPAELAQARRAGQTLAEIAAGQGLTLAELAETLYAAGVERVETALADGKITQARADRLLARLTAWRDACANEGNCWPEPPRQPRNP